MGNRPEIAPLAEHYLSILRRSNSGKLPRTETGANNIAARLMLAISRADLTRKDAAALRDDVIYIHRDLDGEQYVLAVIHEIVEGLTRRDIDLGDIEIPYITGDCRHEVAEAATQIAERELGFDIPPPSSQGWRGYLSIFNTQDMKRYCEPLPEIEVAEDPLKGVCF